jgi:hypothetical protein
MKKILVSFFIASCFVLNLHAVADDSLMKSDETQKKYERKAVMGLADIGFMQNSINIPMQFCTSGQSGYRCTPWSFTVNYPLAYNEKIKAAGTFYDWTITNRFDKIILQNGNAKMFTKNGEMTVETGEYIPYFASGTDSLDGFQNRLENYLNSGVKESLGKLLDATVETRYKELPETEQETFMVTKAKELGVSAEFIKGLVNSSYVFAAHVQYIKGAGKVIRKERKTLDGRTIYFYDVEFDIPVNVTFLIYNYNFESKQFALHKKLVAMSGMVSGSTNSFSIIPTHGQVMAVFNDTFQTAIKAASINANYQLKKDDNFALFMPVKAVNGSKIETDFGVMEDIRVDHPFTVMESVDGEMKKKGYVRARKVSENCDDGYNKPTIMKITNGKAEEADLLREYPWTGLFFNLGFGMNSSLLTGIKDVNGSAIGDIGGMFLSPGLHLGVSIDLGYSTNSSALSEFYMDIFFQTSFGIDDSVDAGRPVWFGGGLGFSKRLYVGAGGFYIAPALNLAYEGGVTLNDYSMQQFIVNPQLHFGFSVNPSFDIVLKGGWNLGFVVQVKDNLDRELDSDLLAMGLTASLDFNFHLPIVGAMAKLYTKPSNVCAVKKKSEKKVEKETE